MKKLHSVLTNDMDHCMFTGSHYVERHHVFGGTNGKRKQASEHRGFIAPLRPDLHPNGVSYRSTPDNDKIDGYLKRRCQEYYETHYGSRDDFRREFGRSYL